MQPSPDRQSGEESEVRRRFVGNDTDHGDDVPEVFSSFSTANEDEEESIMESMQMASEVTVDRSEAFGDERSKEGRVERCILRSALGFLLLTVIGDSIRMSMELKVINSYKNTTARINHQIYIFSLCISSAMSTMGVLGMALLLMLGSQLCWTSYTMQHPSISRMRAVTVDERRFVDSALGRNGGSR